MKVVIDTNIVFSALISAGSSMSEIIMSLQGGLQFFAPELMVSELERYSSKLQKASKLTEEQLALAKLGMLKRITLVSEDLIGKQYWEMAFELTKDVDEDDTPFVALSLELGAMLWTGDKKLSTGLAGKNVGFMVSTQQLLGFLGTKDV